MLQGAPSSDSSNYTLGSMGDMNMLAAGGGLQGSWQLQSFTDMLYPDPPSSSNKQSSEDPSITSGMTWKEQEPRRNGADALAAPATPAIDLEKSSPVDIKVQHMMACVGAIGF